MLNRPLKNRNSDEHLNDSFDKEERLKWMMEEYGQNVIRLAYTYVKDQALAEDVAQDVFIKCYEKLEDFRHEASYKSWIYRITVNKCKDKIKSWNYKNVVLTDLFNTKSNPIESSSQGMITPEQEVVANERSRLISETVLSLPVKLREVVILHYYEEMKIEEVANLLHLNINTVKSRLLRSREKLKRMMGGNGFE